MNLSLLVILPLLTAIIILLCKDLKQVRVIALAGSLLQLLAVFFLYYAFVHERALNLDLPYKESIMLFQYNVVWFAPLNINYHIGVDGISIAMIALTACVVLAGVLVSW